ncbi:hypothetical protein PR048_003478 [Dryococelus australis]|uniref:Uncharacterized protein n=1 Tax=Dryococelus australis TaxID=614101 RepID=A0ABQ9IQ47_9NEOP|nr:hypothetical protein PR048_003478 [Dryococelus australis]
MDKGSIYILLRDKQAKRGQEPVRNLLQLRFRQPDSQLTSGRTPSQTRNELAYMKRGPALYELRKTLRARRKHCVPIQRLAPRALEMRCECLKYTFIHGSIKLASDVVIYKKMHYRRGLSSAFKRSRTLETPEYSKIAQNSFFKAPLSQNIGVRHIQNYSRTLHRTLLHNFPQQNKVPRTHASRRTCAQVDSLANSGDVALDASGIVTLTTPAATRPQTRSILISRRTSFSGLHPVGDCVIPSYGKRFLLRSGGVLDTVSCVSRGVGDRRRPARSQDYKWPLQLGLQSSRAEIIILQSEHLPPSTPFTRSNLLPLHQLGHPLPSFHPPPPPGRGIPPVSRNSSHVTWRAFICQPCGEAALHAFPPSCALGASWVSPACRRGVAAILFFPQVLRTTRNCWYSPFTVSSPFLNQTFEKSPMYDIKLPHSGVNVSYMDGKITLLPMHLLSIVSTAKWDDGRKKQSCNTLIFTDAVMVQWIARIRLSHYQLGSPLDDDRQIMDAVKYKVVAGEVRTNRAMHAHPTEERSFQDRFSINVWFPTRSADRNTHFPETLDWCGVSASFAIRTAADIGCPRNFNWLSVERSCLFAVICERVKGPKVLPMTHANSQSVHFTVYSPVQSLCPRSYTRSTCTVFMTGTVQSKPSARTYARKVRDCDIINSEINVSNVRVKHLGKFCFVSSLHPLWTALVGSLFNWSHNSPTITTRQTDTTLTRRKVEIELYLSGCRRCNFVGLSALEICRTGVTVALNFLGCYSYFVVLVLSCRVRRGIVTPALADLCWRTFVDARDRLEGSSPHQLQLTLVLLVSMFLVSDKGKPGFSRGSPGPPPFLHSGAALIPLRFALAGSQGLFVKRMSNLSTLHSVFPFASVLFFHITLQTRTNEKPGIHSRFQQRKSVKTTPLRISRKSFIISGATVAEVLACSPPTKAIRAQSPAGSLWIFGYGNRAGQCRWSGGFSRGSPFPPPPHSGAAPYSPKSSSSALKTSMLRAVQNLFIEMLKNKACLLLATIIPLLSTPASGQFLLTSGLCAVSSTCQGVNSRGCQSLGISGLPHTIPYLKLTPYRRVNTPSPETRAGSQFKEHPFAQPGESTTLRSLTLSLCEIEPKIKSRSYLLVKTVHGKVSTSEIDLRKMPLALPAYSLTSTLIGLRPVKFVTTDGN